MGDPEPARDPGDPREASSRRVRLSESRSSRRPPSSEGLGAGTASRSGDTSLADRLAIGAVVMAVAVALAWMALPPSFRPAGKLPVPDVVAGALVGASLVMVALARAWRNRPSELALAALAYEVAACLGIALVEQWVPWRQDTLVRGISWVCLALLAFRLAVPMPARRAAVVAVLGASTGPLAMALYVGVAGHEPPSFATSVAIFAPPYLAAGIAVALSMLLTRLDRDASAARHLGGYRLETLLGRGGMGEVWRARHRLLARPAAVKLIRPSRLGEGVDAERVKRRFEREAQVTATLSSPHTISLYDFGVADDGTFYYVMEMLDGVDLELLVTQYGPVPAERAVHLLLQACESLADAHQAGLVHRDIKPANIYVCRRGVRFDFVKVLDFGLVALRGAAGGSGGGKVGRLTEEGFAGGTPAFVAPEMVRGEDDLDARADIYALGCVAYWLLTGHLVFEEKSPVKMMFAHVEHAPVPPSERTENEIPRDLEEVVLACLAKDRAKRPQSARELIRLLAATNVHGRWTEDAAERWWRSHLPDAASTVRIDAPSS
ncbi:MAG: serine/threonine protein kinase [Deltaproteobacteria bacterium]|nr:serine/threonine protein kinase [Deltaproteobacteria bacterium]